MRLIQTGKKTGHDSEPLSLVTLVAMLGQPGGHAGRTQDAHEPDETVTVPWELAASAFGAVESGTRRCGQGGPGEPGPAAAR